jgi:hypothetical protein
MAKELQKRDIDGHTYEFQQYGAKESLKTLIRLSKICGDPIAKAFGAIDQSDSTPLLERKINLTAISGAIEALTASMDENETTDLIEKLTSDRVLCDGKKIVFDSHYENRLDHLFRVLYAALEVQYGNFFAAIAGQASPEPATTNASAISNKSPAT